MRANLYMQYGWQSMEHKGNALIQIKLINQRQVCGRVGINHVEDSTDSKYLSEIIVRAE